MPRESRIREGSVRAARGLASAGRERDDRHHSHRMGVAPATRACSRGSRAPRRSHPKRTVFGGLLSFIVISFLAFGPLKGTLENKFVIPGSDAQKATDVLKAKFGARNGAVLQVVFNAADGRLDTPERKAAIDAALADGRQGRSTRPTSAGPFADNNQRFSKTRPAHRLRRGAVLEGRLPALTQQDRRRSRTRCGRRSRKAGIQAEFTGDADQAPPEQGASELIGIAVRAARAADRVPHARRRGRARSCSRASRSARPSRCSSCWPT